MIVSLYPFNNLAKTERFGFHVFVIPAKAGIQGVYLSNWIPAFAGMTLEAVLVQNRSVWVSSYPFNSLGFFLKISANGFTWG